MSRTTRRGPIEIEYDDFIEGLPDAYLRMLCGGGNLDRGNDYDTEIAPEYELALTIIEKKVRANHEGESEDESDGDPDGFPGLFGCVLMSIDDLADELTDKFYLDGTPFPKEPPCVLCKKVAGDDGTDPCIGYIDDPKITGACCGHGREQPSISYREDPDDRTSEVTVFIGVQAAERLWPDPTVRQVRRMMFMSALGIEDDDDDEEVDDGRPTA